MSFIRLKKRVTKTKENYYAYLVSNKWYKNLPKQKVSQYLGRYHKLMPKQTNIELPKHKNILISLIKKELLHHNFKEKSSNFFFHPEGFLINLKTYKVLNSQKNPVCLGLNQGYFCTYTLKNLSKFKKTKNKKQASKTIIRLLLEIGITPNKDQFEEVLKNLDIF
ncbi:MAG: hypothetical protein AABW58_00330 [Nanoarchaeota archaeon]